MHEVVLIVGFFALGLSPCLLTLRLVDEERAARAKDPEAMSQLRA